MTAAIVGAVLGTASVLAVYLLMRPDTAPGSKSAAASPFRRANPAAAAPQQSPTPPESPATASAPVTDAARPAASFAAVPRVLETPPAAATPEADAARPAASFAAAPHSRVTGEEPQPAPAEASAPAEPREQEEEASWIFKGLVFDLLTTRGVSGVKLSFLDAAGNVVGETTTGQAGRYEISLPAVAGCKLKISHDGYTGRYIEEGDATSALREATPEERQTLMSAVARNLPWTGDPKKPVQRDIALMPSAEDL
jgi:hypothetical protein